MKIGDFVKNYRINNCNYPNFRGINNPKVSVILPIYNQERFLPAALDSLQKQTLTDTEFVCINDGSHDASPEILKSFADRDKRVKIINQKNQGSGSARNKGLEAAKGEYISFLDPDDILEPDALDTLYKKSKNLDCDMVVFNFKRVNENGETRWKGNVRDRLQKVFDILENKTFNWRNIKPEVFEGLYLMVWNKLYKKDFVESAGLKFSDCSLAEDNIFSIGAALNAKSIGYSPEYFYNYIRHENSAVRRLSDKNLCIFDVISDVKALIKKLGLEEELKDEFDKYVLSLMSYHAKQIVSQDKLKLLCQKRLSEKQNRMIEEKNLI